MSRKTWFRLVRCQGFASGLGILILGMKKKSSRPRFVRRGPRLPRGCLGRVCDRPDGGEV